MSPDKKHRCEKMDVPDSTGYHFTRCQKNAKYREPNGKWYCGLHSPSLYEERRKRKESTPEFIKAKISHYEYEIKSATEKLAYWRKRLEELKPNES